ncbi:MAG: putative Ig domain-containing protein [Acidobacteriota bacterium]
MRHRVEALALAAYLVSATRLWALEPGSKPGSVVDGHPVLEVTPAAVLEKGDGAAVGDLKRPAITAIDALGGTTPNKVQNFVNEVEPNGTVATANFLSGTSGVVSGNVYPNADEDYFAINGTVGDRIYVATMTFFSASGSSNSQLYVYRSDGTTLIEFDEDDGSLGGLASTIAGATLLDTGVSYIRVKHMSAAGQIRPYRLYYQVRTGATAPEIEPNDTTTNATPLVTGWANGSINPAADADFYSFNMNAGDTAYLSLDLDPERDGTTWNGVVGICCFDNYILTVNDASVTSPNSEATFMTALTTGTYYAFVTENASGGAPTDTYHLSVTINPRAPQTGCTTYTSTDVPKAIPAAGGNVTSTLTVPGNPRIDDLSVVLNLNHAAMPDLDVTLISPKNNNNGLFIDEPAPPAGVTLFNQVLSDSAGIPINAYGVFAGMMGEPQGFGATGFRLGWFYGENAGGTWTLSLTDDTNNASGGTLNSWGLTVCTPSAPSGCGPNSYQATPFTTDFEANNGGFTHSGTQDEWAWGLPNNPPINDCNGGVGCWKTDLLGTYNASSTQDLLSPGISLAGLSSPIRVSWSQKYQMESTSFDHAFVDVREVGNPANAKRLWEWLDTTMTVTQGATLIQESAGWADYTADISSFAGLNVELRFHVDSDTTGQYAGLAIDDVTVTGCATCQAITLSPGTLPSGVVGSAYGQTITASGGTAPYTFAVTSGALPPGLALLPTGDLSGVPTTAGVYNFTVTATDANGCTGSLAYQVLICNVISLAPATLPNGTQGVPYSQTITASGGTAPYSFAVTAGSLPAGLSLSAGGVLSGTPTTPGTSSFTVTATDSGGCTGSRAYQLTIDCPTITVAPASLPNGTVGVPYSQTITASGGTAPYTFAVTSGALPPGLALAANGVLSGTPTAVGTYNFTVTATDANACTGSLAYALTINPPGCNPITVSPATLPNGSVGVAYSQTITASGGTAPYTFAVTLGSVPPGLTLTPAGVLGGVPTTAGTYAFTVTATDVNGCTGSQAYSIVICGTITLSPASLPNGTIGTAYSQTITASGGTAPYTFAVTAGALPPGLGLSSGGILSGTPTALGSFNFTVTATDTDGCAGNQAYTIVITCGTITLSPASLPNGTVGVAYSQTITASGGTAPYTFAVTAGALPPGLALSSGGVLSGTPTSAGTFNFTVTATDANGCTGNRAYSLVIGCGTITLSPPSLPVGTVGTAYSQTITASGGTAPYSFAVTAGSLPPGLALSAGGVLSGVPTTAGTFNFTVTATDAQGCTGNLAYSLIINPINCPTITLSPATLPNGTVGTPYSQTITASGGAAPYTFAVTAGTVPTGLSLSAGGVLSGTPAAAGSFAFTVTATDANGCSGSQAYTVTVSTPDDHARASRAAG